MKRIVSGLMIVIWMITLLTGCDQMTTETKDSGSVEKSIDADANYTTQLEGETLVTVLSGNLLVPNVATFLDTLAIWGYSYRQSNSFVLVQNHYRRTTGPADNLSEKAIPDHSYTELVSSDTLVWQVFENAALDSSVHTAVITASSNGKVQSAFVEFDISSSDLTLIHGGILAADGELVDGEFVGKMWKDYSICVTACCASVMLLCILSGPGWPACAAAGCLDCYPGCAVHALVSSLLNWLSGD